MSPNAVFASIFNTLLPSPNVISLRSFVAVTKSSPAPEFTFVTFVPVKSILSLNLDVVNDVASLAIFTSDAYQTVGFGAVTYFD